MARIAGGLRSAPLQTSSSFLTTTDDYIKEMGIRQTTKAGVRSESPGSTRWVGGFGIASQQGERYHVEPLCDEA